MCKTPGISALATALALAAPAADTREPIGVALPERGTPAYTRMQETYSRTIQPVFEAKCFACHFSAVKGSWFYRATYTRKRAIKDIDFAGGFPFSGRGSPELRLQLLADSIVEGSMPPFMRRLTKPSSKITKDERAAILAWLKPEPAILTRTTGGKPAE